MPIKITAQEIDVVLTRWGNGESTHTEVHAWAEARYSVDTWEPESEVVNEVLGHLDRMDMNLVLPVDIPLLRKALLVQTVEGVCQLIEGSYSLNPIKDRMRACAGDEFYAPFCK